MTLAPPAPPFARRSPAHRLAAWTPVVLYAALIFFLSSRPIPPSLAPPQGFDKLVHFVEYGILGFCLAFALFREGLAPGRAVVLAFALGALYGIGDEIHQAFVPERSAEVLDAVADAVGSLCGAYAYAVAHRLWLRRAVKP